MLETFTNQELIDELTARATFRGIVLWQVEFKGTEAAPWQYRYTNCDPIEVLIEIMPQMYFHEKAKRVQGEG